MTPERPDAPPTADERARRAARREYVRTHHPDAGGDPEAFAAGLARFDAPAARPVPTSRPRVQVRRSRRLDRVVARSVRRLRRRLAGRPRRDLK